jgi:hypothetical protein
MSLRDVITVDVSIVLRWFTICLLMLISSILSFRRDQMRFQKERPRLMLILLFMMIWLMSASQEILYRLLGFIELSQLESKEIELKFILYSSLILMLFPLFMKIRTK